MCKVVFSSGRLKKRLEPRSENVCWSLDLPKNSYHKARRDSLPLLFHLPIWTDGPEVCWAPLVFYRSNGGYWRAFQLFPWHKKYVSHKLSSLWSLRIWNKNTSSVKLLWLTDRKSKFLPSVCIVRGGVGGSTRFNFSVYKPRWSLKHCMMLKGMLIEPILSRIFG